MDMSQITKTFETSDSSEVDNRLEQGWVLLAAGGGKDVDGMPCILYSLGYPGRPALGT